MKLLLDLIPLRLHFYQSLVSDRVDFLKKFIKSRKLIDTFSIFPFQVSNSSRNEIVHFCFEIIKVLRQIFYFLVNYTVNFVFKHTDILS